MNLFELALRNVLRNRRRTLITVAMTGVAAATIVLLGGYVSSTIKGLETETVRDTGHLQIMARGYPAFGKSDPGRYSIRDYEALSDRLRADPVLRPMIGVVTPLLQVQGVAGHFDNDKSTTFIATGRDAVARDRMGRWDGHRLGFAPTASELDVNRPEAGVIGVGLAQLLGLCERLDLADCEHEAPDPARADARPITTELAQLGEQTRALGAGAITRPAGAATAGDGALDGGNDRGGSGVSEVSEDRPPVAIELLGAGSSGAPNIVRLEIARAARQGSQEVDQLYVGMPLPLAQRLVFGAAGGGASALAVLLDDPRDLARARGRIERLLAAVESPSLAVLSYNEVALEFDQIVAMFRALLGFLVALMIVIALFSVGNTVNMAISERTAEIGSLRAMGLRRADIRRLFLLEGGLLGLLGGLAGTVGAILIGAFGVNRAGLAWTPPGNTAPVPISIDIASSAVLGMAVVVVTMVVACLSSWWPARRAANQPIVEALRHG